MWSGTGIEPIWVVRPMLIAVAFTLLLTFLLALLLGDRDRGALAATAFVVALALGNVLASAAVALIGLLVVVEGLVNRGIAWRLGRTATRALSALGAALILVVVLASVQQGSFGWAVEDVQARLARQPMAAAYDPAAPDIYVILLDGYPGDDAAELDPSFDADAFPDALEERGFDVQRHSRSNYLLTRLTLATMFGNDHVADDRHWRVPTGHPRPTTGGSAASPTRARSCGCSATTASSGSPRRPRPLISASMASTELFRIQGYRSSSSACSESRSPGA